MKTPLNVMIDVSALEALNAMAAERKKTRTAMVTELIMGTSKAPMYVANLIQSWFNELDTVDQADIDRLKDMIRG